MHLDELAVKRFGATNVCLEPGPRPMLSAMQLNQNRLSALLMERPLPICSMAPDVGLDLEHGGFFAAARTANAFLRKLRRKTSVVRHPCRWTHVDMRALTRY
jgi:hypothetical protein